jgi:hypothetical protein
MSRNSTGPSEQATGLATLDDARGCLPPVTPHERDFWRRAVAEQRQRLELTGSGAPRQLRAEVH